MLVYREGEALPFCDTCHCLIVGEVIAEPGRNRSLRMVDKDRVTGADKTTRDALHFCNQTCLRGYVYPRNGTGRGR